MCDVPQGSMPHLVFARLPADQSAPMLGGFIGNVTDRPEIVRADPHHVVLTFIQAGPNELPALAKHLPKLLSVDVFRAVSRHKRRRRTGGPLS